MRVRLSPAARSYLLQEASYLRARSRHASAAFMERMKTAFADLAAFEGMGFPGEELPVPNMRRLVRAGYRIDYTIEQSEVWVVAVSSSINVPLDTPDDDFNYEGDG